MKQHFSHYKAGERGFTLVETVIAILILSLSIGSLLSLAAGGFFSVRYARNQIVADNMLQESLEYLRNSRDTAVLQDIPWSSWVATLNVDSDGNQVSMGTPSGCFASNGCTIDPYTAAPTIRACGGSCPVSLFFPDHGFYGYATGDYPFSGGTAPIATSYSRKIVAEQVTGDEIIITASMTWLNGTASKTVSQSIILTNWNQL